MNNFLIALGALVFAVLAALFAVPHFVDWNRYRGTFEEEVSRIVGRDVRVGGAVNLRLFPAPYVSFEKVRIADSETGSGEPFFRAESINIWLSVAPLVRGVIEASEIELDRPQLRLALDGRGGGNWQTLGKGENVLPFVPRDVALQSVRITAGTITVVEPDGSERLRLESVQGELGAPSIEGPYRIRATYGAAGSERELRLATTTPEPDGGVHFKGSLKRVDTGFTATLDGRATGLSSTPRIDGDLLALVPLPRSRTTGKVAEPPLEIKTKVVADLEVARLTELTVAFEQQGQPQILTGDAEASWRGGLGLATSLSSRWLDLDQLVGVTHDQSPLTALIEFMADLNGAGGFAQRSAVVVAVEQANLGHESVSGLRLVVKGSGGETTVEDLRVGLPGGSRADVKGRVTGSRDNATFVGETIVRGTSLARFTSWATAGALVLDPATDGAFALRSTVTVEPGRITARDLTGELAGTAVQGEVGYGWRGGRDVLVQLEGPQIDLRQMLPEKFAFADAIALLTGVASANDMAAAVRLRTGRLMLPGRVLDDVAVDIDVKNQHLWIGQFKAQAAPGIAIDLEGDVIDLAARPQGTLRGFVSAETADSIAALSTLVDWPVALRPDSARRQPLAPLRLAGSLLFGQHGPAAEIAADGTANSARVRLSARLEGGLATWRDKQADLALTVDAEDASQILTLLGANAGGAIRSPMTGGPGPSGGASQLKAKAIGVPGVALSSLITLEANDTSLSFRGDLKSGEQGLDLFGDIVGRASDGAQITRLIGILPQIGLDGRRIDGTARLEMRDGQVRFDRLAMMVGGATVNGNLAVAPVEDRRRVTGRLDVSTMPVSALFQPVLDRRGTARNAAAQLISGPGGAWPDTAFDFSALKGFEANIELRAARLELTNGAALERARINIVLAPSGLIELRDFDGSGLGGRWGGAMRLEPIPAGGALSGLVRLTSGRMDGLLGEGSEDATSRASGVFNAVLTFAGRGIGPRGVISALSGGGSVDLGATRLRQVAPAGIAAAFESALREPAESMREGLRQKLVAARKAGTVPLGPLAMPFDLADGVIKLRPLVTDRPDGRVTLDARVDLATLTYAGEWSVEAKLTGASLGAKITTLPPVVMVYSGPLEGFGRSEPTVAMETFERELTVRKMERDLEELELLRKLDEQRAKEEADRQRQSENIKSHSPIVAPSPAFGTTTVLPVPPAIDLSTTPTPAPDVPVLNVPVSPPAPREQPAPAASGQYRPLTANEARQIFNDR